MAGIPSFFKRIIETRVKASVTSQDYVLVDNITTGTWRVPSTVFFGDQGGGSGGSGLLSSRGYIDGFNTYISEEAGDNEITGFTNIDYDTFSATGPVINSTIKSTAGDKELRSVAFGGTQYSGHRYAVTINLTVNSGQRPFVQLLDSVGAPASAAVQISATGITTTYLTSTAVPAYLQFSNTNNANWQTVGDVFCSRLVSDALRHVHIRPGALIDSTNTDGLVSNAMLFKDIKTAWDEGDAKGGIPPSLLPIQANTYYHFFIIWSAGMGQGSGSSGGDPLFFDAGWDTDINASNLLAYTGHTFFRRIKTTKTNSSIDITPYLQNGDDFYWRTPILDVDTNAQDSASVNYQISVPPDVRSLAKLNIFAEAPIAYPVNYASVYVRSPELSDLLGTPSGSPLATMNWFRDDGIGVFSAGVQCEVLTDISRQIRVSTNSSTNLDFFRAATLGYKDFRGRNL